MFCTVLEAVLWVLSKPTLINEEIYKYFVYVEDHKVNSVCIDFEILPKQLGKHTITYLFLLPFPFILLPILHFKWFFFSFLLVPFPTEVFPFFSPDFKNDYTPSSHIYARRLGYKFRIPMEKKYTGIKAYFVGRGTALAFFFSTGGLNHISK